MDHRKRLLSLSAPIIDNILGFHAMIGCDTISLILGLESFLTICQFPYLIQNLGRDGSQNDTEEFDCRLYRAPNIETGVNKIFNVESTCLKKEIKILRSCHRHKTL